MERKRKRERERETDRQTERGHSIHKDAAVLHSGFGTRMSVRQEKAMENHSCTAKLAQKILCRITRSLNRLDGLLLLLRQFIYSPYQSVTAGCPNTG
jgi:hypothetical protein